MCAQVSKNIFSLTNKQKNVSLSASYEAEASFHRGIKLAVDADLYAGLQATIGKKVRAAFEGGASLKAGLTLQANFLLDLFKEAGLVARFKAQAEASAFVRAEIDLAMKRFYNLVSAKLQPQWKDLLMIFFDEIAIGAGIWTGVSASAQILGEATLTGTLFQSKQREAGFTYSLRYAYGFGLGAGYEFFVNYKLPRPQQLIQRVTDSIVTNIESALTLQIKKLAQPDAAAAKEAMIYLQLILPIVTNSLFDVGKLSTSNLKDKKTQASSIILQELFHGINRLVLPMIEDYAMQKLNLIFVELSGKLASSYGKEVERINRILKDIDQTLEKIRNLKGVDLNFSDITNSLEASMQLSKILSEKDSEHWQENVAFLWSTVVIVHQIPRLIEEAKKGTNLEILFKKTIVGKENSNISTYVASKTGKKSQKDLSIHDLIKFILTKDRFDGLQKTYSQLDSILSWLSGIVGAKDKMEFIAIILKDFAQAQKDVQIIKRLPDSTLNIINKKIIPNLFNRISKSQSYQTEIMNQILQPILKSLKHVLEGIPNIGKSKQYDEKLREQISAILLQFLARLMVTSIDILLEYALEHGSAYVDKLAKNIKNKQGAYNNLIPVVSTVILGTPLTRDEVVDMLKIVSGSMTILNKQRKSIIAPMGDLLSLGLTNGKDNLNEVLNTLANSNNPPMGNTVKQFLKNMVKTIWKLLAYVVPRVLKIWLLHYANVGKWVIEEIISGVKAVVKLIKKGLGNVKEKIKQLKASLSKIKKKIKEILEKIKNVIKETILKSLKKKRKELEKKHTETKKELKKNHSEQKEKEDLLTKIFTKKRISITIEKPAEENVYETTKPFQITLNGINNTFFNKIAGLQRRIRLFFNGTEYDYSQHDWVERKGEFLFDAKNASISIEREPKTTKKIVKKIILRPGLNTLQVIASDGEKEQQEKTRTFYLQLSH